MQVQTRKKWLAGGLLLVLVLALAGVIVALQMGASPVNAGAESGLSVDPWAEDWSGSLAGTGESGMGSTKIPGYATLYFPAGSKRVNLTLPNDPSNECYFEYTLEIDGETLYTSGLIEPGKAVKELELSRALESGEYTLTIHIQPYSLSEKAPQVSANVNADLIVS